MMATQDWGGLLSVFLSRHEQQARNPFQIILDSVRR